MTEIELLKAKIENYKKTIGPVRGINYDILDKFIVEVTQKTTIKNDNFKFLKVFDCQDMPEEVKKEFFSKKEARNDCFVNYFVCDGNIKLATQFKDILKIENISEDGYGYESGDDIISDWLLENGATILEEVLISHNW